ncbi:MAG: hypothetical protein HOZ81_47470 [Streptomyces sp.]|nr:hypothetical protein [Streptomyces sp.]
MTAADLARVDVPLDELIRRVDEMAAMKRAHMAAGLLLEERHQHDPDDAALAARARTCKTLPARDDDYPGFAAWVAQQEAKNRAARKVS